MQHYHLLRELRIAQLYLGLWVENNSDSPSGEEGHVETVVIIIIIVVVLLLLSFSFVGPKDM